MQKKLVRCYRAQAVGPVGLLEDVLFALPDFGYDYRLYSCLSCGALFTASGEDEQVRLSTDLRLYFSPRRSLSLGAPFGADKRNNEIVTT